MSLPSLSLPYFGAPEAVSSIDVTVESENTVSVGFSVVKGQHSLCETSNVFVVGFVTVAHPSLA